MVPVTTSTQSKGTEGDDRRARTPTSAITCDLDSTSTNTLRQLVRRLLAGRTGVAVDDAVLVTDELATNAVRHGAAPRRCRVWLFDERHCVRVEVDDSGPGEPRIATPDSAGGRGLLLVDRLAHRWGVRHHAQRKTVWAEVKLARQPTAAR